MHFIRSGTCAQPRLPTRSLFRARPTLSWPDAIATPKLTRSGSGGERERKPRGAVPQVCPACCTLAVTGFVACAADLAACRAFGFAGRIAWFACRTPAELVGCHDMLKTRPTKLPIGGDSSAGRGARQKVRPTSLKFRGKCCPDLPTNLRHARQGRRSVVWSLNPANLKKNIQASWPEALGKVSALLDPPAFLQDPV